MDSYRTSAEIYQQITDIDQKIDTKNATKQKLLRKLLQIQAQIEKEETEINALTKQQTNLYQIYEQTQKRENDESENKDGKSVSSRKRVGMEMDRIAKKYYGFELRPHQFAAIRSLIKGRDVVCIMATGAGKSIIYQLSSLMHNYGFTLVISPLISLMHDQVSSLKQKNIPAYLFSAGTKTTEFREIAQRMKDPNASSWLLYVTPEKIIKSGKFKSMLHESFDLGLIQKFAIDEAHCASVWGHDFRPDYKKLSILRQEYPGCPIVALTATSTTVVTTDLSKILKLENPEYVRTSLDRKNLEFSVVPKLGGQKTLDMIYRCIHDEFGTVHICGIIYCYSKKETEELAKKLCEKGLKASHYHAGMTEIQRNKVHDQWMAGKLMVICATIAFGMGIDKPDVRFVFHFTMSKSLENYYQEAGRAGRDGKRSICITFFSFTDVFKQTCLNYSTVGAGDKIYAFTDILLNAHDCRRALFGRYFNETRMQQIADCTEKYNEVESEPKLEFYGSCDTCCSKLMRGGECVPEVDYTQYIKHMIQLIGGANSMANSMVVGNNKSRKYSSKKSLSGSLTPNQLLKVFSSDQLLKSNLSNFQMQLLVFYMLKESYLQETFKSNTYQTNSYITTVGKPVKGLIKLRLPKSLNSNPPKFRPEMLEKSGKSSQNNKFVTSSQMIDLEELDIDDFEEQYGMNSDTEIIEVDDTIKNQKSSTSKKVTSLDQQFDEALQRQAYEQQEVDFVDPEDNEDPDLLAELYGEETNNNKIDDELNSFELQKTIVESLSINNENQNTKRKRVISSSSDETNATSQSQKSSKPKAKVYKESSSANKENLNPSKVSDHKRTIFSDSEEDSDEALFQGQWAQPKSKKKPPPVENDEIICLD